MGHYAANALKTTKKTEHSYKKMFCKIINLFLTNKGSLCDH